MTDDKIKMMGVLACEGGYLSILEILYKETPSINEHNNAFMAVACEHGHLDIIKYLILLTTKGVDLTDSTNEYVARACRSGNLEIVQYLIESGCNPANLDELAIRVATVGNHPDVVGYLLSKGVSKSALNIPLQRASVNGHLAVVKLLLEHGANPCADGGYAIKLAKKNGHTSVVDHYAQLGYKYKHKYTYNRN